MGADGQPAEQGAIWPPTNEQDAEAKQAFVDAIDPAAVCGLASRLGGGRPCHLFQEAARGSFNVCFFVELGERGETPTTRWVVRVPIEPALHDARAKLESEVATMRYVARTTTIPIAHVQAYGHDVELGRPGGVATRCSYLVVDYVAGEPLDLEAFLDDTPTRQHYLYGQLLDVLAQLRGRTFATGGSLLAGDAADGSDVVVGPLQCAGHNELQRLTGGRARTTLATFRTAADFALAQHRVLQEAFAVPMASASLANLRMEAFALHDLRGRLVDVLGGQDDKDNNNNTFVLAHTDLRWSNILVDDQLTVQAVIDWEWSAAVPLLFFQPPTWLAGPSPCYVASLAYEKAYGDFHALLQTRAAAADGPRRDALGLLAATWTADLPTRIELPLAVILLQHYHLVPAYYFSVFPRFHDVTRSRHHMPPATVARLLALDADVGGPLSRDVCRRWRVAHAYRRHLAAAGLLVEYELAGETRTWLAKRDALRARMLDQTLRQYADEGRPPTDAFARILLESVLQASIQPRNVEPLLGEPVLKLDLAGADVDESSSGPGSTVEGVDEQKTEV